MCKVKLSSICLLLVALLFVKCKDENLSPGDSEKWPDGQSVYVIGYDGGGPRLWKNGVVQNFNGASGSTLRSRSAITKTVANSVYVSGDDVYVTGWDEIVTGDKWYNDGGVIVTNGDETVYRARLWKNGEVQNLDGGTFPDQAYSVFVSGNDVYVLGREALQPVIKSSRWAFKVWKNGVSEIFAEGSEYWTIKSIFVSAGNVYVTGYYNNTWPNLIAALWKNGVAEDLDLANGSSAHSVFVSGGDVYVAGYGIHPDGGNLIKAEAQLWKNGKVQKLTDSASPQNAEALSVYVSDNGDVYVAGYDGDEARLWKNGKVQDVADSKDAIRYNSVFVKGNDVYLAGCIEIRKKVSSGLEEIQSQAKLWKNGKRLSLQVVENVISDATSVFVK